MVKIKAHQLDATFAALSDPTRRAIVRRLARGDASVGELGKPFAMSAPAISRHLRVLEGAGLLVRRKQGRVHRCRLNPQPIREATSWIEECRQFWEGRFDALDTFLAEWTEEE